MTLDEALSECPAVAIIRGVRPDEAVAVAEALYAGGLRAVEVPLNSPEPLVSIDALAKAFAGRMAVGAGTVLSPDRVDAVAEAGGTLIVAPNADPAVIARACERGLIPIPGVGTATEAFSALKAGAIHLKLFPAATYGPGHVRQLKAVLPPSAVVWAVGGVGPDAFAQWWTAGVRAFGIGSEVYKAGQTPEATHEKARRVCEAAKALAS